MPWYEIVFYVLSAVAFTLTVLTWLRITPNHLWRTAKRIVGPLRAWVPVMATLAVLSFGLTAIITEIRAIAAVWDIMMKAVIIIVVLISNSALFVATRRRKE